MIRRDRQVQEFRDAMEPQVAMEPHARGRGGVQRERKLAAGQHRNRICENCPPRHALPCAPSHLGLTGQIRRSTRME